MKVENMLFAKRLREEREAKHLTQAELAKAIDSHANVIWQYENGKRNPTLENGSKIAKILQVDLNYLIGLSNTNDFKSVTLGIQELLLEVRKFFKDSQISQEAKDTFYHNITLSYWKTKKGV